MASTQLGKFCESCQKEVIDFTTMSDAEIILFFKNNKDKCGSFKASQLNRNLFPIHQSNTHRPAKYFFASLLSLNFLSASASINPKPKIENDSVAVVVDSTIVKNDSVELTKVDSAAVPKFYLNDSIFKLITINPYSIIGRDIVTSGVPMINNFVVFDSTFFNQLYNGVSFLVVDTVRKIKMPSKILMPFTSNYKEENEKLILPNNAKKKQKPIKSVLPFQAILTKRIFFNQKTKWFDWW
jgi:hypothetical protein